LSSASERPRAIWAGGAVVLIFAVPLILSTCLLGLLIAEWLSPNLMIEGAWTCVGACAITAVLLLTARQLRALTCSIA